MNFIANWNAIFMFSKSTLPGNSIARFSLNFFLTIAFLPVCLMAISFSFLEVGVVLGIGFKGFFLNIIVVALSIYLSYMLALKVGRLLPCKGYASNLLVEISDILLCLFICSYIFYFFFSYHYVTPSASVFYYIFYDYLRLLADTGFYRPPLPVENPAGTWHSMLTYSPVIGSAVAMLSVDAEIENYRSAFALLTGITNVSAMIWIGIYSRLYLGVFFPGIAVGYSVFGFIEQAGLAQQIAYIGSHDLPMFYFSVMGVALSFIVILGFKSLNVNSALLISYLSFCVIVLGLSMRPYLASLAVAVFLLLMTCIIIYFLKVKSGFRSVAKIIKDNSFIVWFSTFFLFVGAYWFIIILFKYDVLVVYSHSVQFKGLTNFSDAIFDRFELVLSVFLNDSDGYFWFSKIHQSLFLISTVVFLLCLLIKKNRFHLSFVVFFLFVSLVPLLLSAGAHWKMYYTQMIIQYLFFPMTAFILMVTWLSKQGEFRAIEKAFFLLPFFGYMSFSLLIPSSSMDDLFNNDQIFREEVASYYQSGKKMLVLRGGEPGGDAQSLFDNYYYWDNVFLFGEVDQDFKEKTVKLNDFLCRLKSENVNLIFEPTTLNIENHSGEVHGKVVSLIKSNKSVFKQVVNRGDAYKGVVYLIDYSGFSSSLKCD